MKHLFVHSLFILCLQFYAFSQGNLENEAANYNTIYNSVLDDYGLNQVLVNGVSYENKYRSYTGHQFLLEDKFYKGNLVFKEKEYKDLNLKYDIYDQQLIVFIQQNNLAINFVPSTDFITSFSLGNLFFEKYNFQEVSQFYQVVIDTDKITCLYYWSKGISNGVQTGNTASYKFNKSTKKGFLKLDQSFERFKNNNSFIKLFPENIKPSIRKYMNSYDIKVNKSSEREMENLLNYCNSIL